MDDIAYLITGILILAVTLYDFFFTTLSGSGLGSISKAVAIYADKVVKLLTQLLGRRFFKINGLTVNLTMLFTWVILTWLGLFLLYSSNPEAIVNGNGDTADVWERLYFTGYIISTLGIGPYYPITPFFEIITSSFAFFGFVLFTSSMTYFISVSSALVQKRTLVKNIYGLGRNPQEIAEKLTSFSSSYSYQQFLNLQDMVNKHAVNHHAYPVVHFYTRPKPKECLSLNLARLDEALSILKGSDNKNDLRKEMEPLRSAIYTFLKNLDKSFSQSMPKVGDSVQASYFDYDQSITNDEEQKYRRRILERLLKSEGLKWSDVVQH